MPYTFCTAHHLDLNIICCDQFRNSVKLLVLCKCVTVLEWKSQQVCYKVLHVVVYVIYGYVLEFGIYCLK
jgi:hypothetical protein